MKREASKCLYMDTVGHIKTSMCGWMCILMGGRMCKCICGMSVYVCVCVYALICLCIYIYVPVCACVFEWLITYVIYSHVTSSRTWLWMSASL